MMTEWLKVMLEEVARKKADAEEAELERKRRRNDEAAAPPDEARAAAEG